ncbi:MAG: trigger factor [Desulfovibrionaceae bacterium]|nr:trigger factor [Desulfovibrionaceae bacterium]
MEYEVEELGPLKRKVAVRASAVEVDALLDRVVVKYRSRASVPGFRKGKAPSRMVEKQFIRDILPEVRESLLEEQTRSILAELKLEPLTGPFHEAGSPVRGQDFSYKFTLEFMPEFTLPAYQDFPLEEEEVEVLPSELDEAMERLREQMAAPAPVEEKRGPADGDLVSVDFVFFDSAGREIPEMKSDRAMFRLGGKNGLADLEGMIKNLHPGEEAEGQVSVPEDFGVGKAAGQILTARVKLHEFFKMALPELNDEFAGKAGSFNSLAALREAMSSGILQRKAQLAKNVAQRKLLDTLMRQVDYPLPEDLVDQHASRAGVEILRRGQQLGKPLENARDALFKAKAEARPQAEDIVRGYIFLQKVAKAENIRVEEQDLLRHFRNVAAESGRSLEEVQKDYVRNNMLGRAYDQIITDKAMQSLYTQARITRVRHESLEKPVTGKKVAAGNKPSTGKKPAAAEAALNNPD